jgi:hypothetical protein
MGVQIIDKRLLDETSAKAEKNERLRMNHNIGVYDKIPH